MLFLNVRPPSVLLVAVLFRLKYLTIASVAVEEEDDGTVPLIDLVVWLNCITFKVYSKSVFWHFKLIDESVIDSLRAFL